MASRLENLIAAMVTHITTIKASGDPALVLNSFTITPTYRPAMSLKDMTSAGQLYLVGIAGDQNRITRSKVFTEEIGIQFGLQYPIVAAGLATEYDEVNIYVNLLEQLKDAAAALNSTAINSQVYTWLRTVSLKDENEMPLNFQGMRDANIFEAYWTCFYSVTSTNRYV